MPEERIYPDTIQEAVEAITRYLEDTSSRAHKAIYFDGWSGLAASAVLRAIAEHPPPSVRKKFDKIIHIDCSRWKSRRALQRAIVEGLKLPQRVMAILDQQDEEDDFSGVEEGSREEMQDVTREIYQTIRVLSCLVIFHSGSDYTVDIASDYWFSPINNKVLWTFRGRLRLNPEIKEKVDKSHLYLYDTHSRRGWKYLLQEEAREIAWYTGKLGVTPEIAAECCSYMLSLNSQGGSIMDYNWAIHASNYWVCDGIIVQGGQYNEEAWDTATALHQELRLEDYSSSTLPSFGDALSTPPYRWIFVTDSVTVHPESTSFFLTAESGSDHPLPTLPNDMFHQSDKLRVLKLCRCTFSFSLPPFHCCRSLRFLGIDSCKDAEPQEETPKQGRPELGFFQSLWVLDICNTDWELALFPKIIEQIAPNIREVYIKKGRIWRGNLSWRRLHNIHKLRVIEPTSSWETGQNDEFTNMEKLELLDLSRNSTMQVLPSLSRAASLKTLVLDGCVGLEHVGPEGVPPSLESFSLDARVGGDHKISRICLAGCARLMNFKLHGPLPNIKELDISQTAIQTLELKDEVIHVPSLQRIILLGCEQLRFVLWPKNGMQQLRILCIDNRVEEVRNLSSGSLIPKTPCNTYTDVHIDEIITDHDDSSARQFQPLDCHVEIGEGIGNNNVERVKAIEAIIVVMERVESLHVHDNSSITTIIPKRMVKLHWPCLKRCCVERCPKLGTVFTTNYNIICFGELETFWAADLPMARCIWSKGTTDTSKDSISFAKLRSIHLHSCPRLTFVLPLSWAPWTFFPNLETLHIVYCGDLRQVFPMKAEFLNKIAKGHRNGVLEFPKLKHFYLHDLPSLQQICEAKMFAPMLETIKVRGCWSLRRLPAVGHGRPIVDCEKDWWDELKWDGKDVGHDASLFDPYHSQYYRKPLPRGSILR